MKRFGLALLLVLALLAITAPKPPIAHAAGVNNFTIEDYQIDLYLDRASDGRSALKTVESITAVFPESDQNHGIERAIPNSYDGHPTSLKIDAVVDQNNTAYPFTTYTSNANTVVRIGDANKYVHGSVTYKLTYNQRDVTKYFSDTNRDEFYWDTNGTEWRVPITTLTTRLHIADSINAAVTGDQACYSGFQGSSSVCTLVQENGSYTTSTTNLSPSENVTIAIGFKAGTFNAYKKPLVAVVFGILFLISMLGVPFAIILIIWFSVRYQRRSNRSSELKTIIPEYIPPPDTSVSTSAAIGNKARSSFSAQLIDFAVRHYIRIYETREKTLFKPANYELEIIKDISSLKEEEQELFRDIFTSTEIGAKLDMSTMKKNYSLSAKLQDNPGKLNASIAGIYGLRARDDVQSHWFRRTGVITLIFAVLTFSPLLLVAAICSFIFGAILKPLTDKGLALAQYLKGLELYIKVAETERLKMLQSPEGAAKVGESVDPNDTKQLIKLYERVLPYAILFGQEKEWNKRLGDYYESANSSPSWYSGNNTVFNAAVFSTAMSNFSSSATYSSPSSSSSGGSGGGGFSGGGGGGGGGGGW